MEDIFRNPGFSIIAIEIFQKCGLYIKQARLVCKSWKDIIDNAMELKRPRLQLKLRAFRKSPQNQRFFIRWPTWKNTINHFIRFRSTEDMEKLVEILRNHMLFGDRFDYDPLLAAARFNDLSTFDFLRPSIIYLYDLVNAKGSCLHNAMYYSSMHVIERIIQLRGQYRWRTVKNGDLAKTIKENIVAFPSYSDIFMK